MNLARLLEYVESLLERRSVCFSKPVLGQETRRDPPSRFSTGGLRQVGEWISTCALVDRALRTQQLESQEFYSSDTGRRFVRALESRVCSLTATQLFQVLVAANHFKAPVEHVILNELQGQISDLETTALLRLPSLVKTGSPEFWSSLSKELDSRHIGKLAPGGVQEMLREDLLDSYRSAVNQKLI